MNAPIVLFVYNRPEHALTLLKSLESNKLSKKSILYIYADGPKSDAVKEQLEKINETRRIVKLKKWCSKVTIIERKKNMGLANSVIAGVTEVINKHGTVIVLEDDLILSKNFLKYMNNALDIFEKKKKVMQISGYLFPVVLENRDDALFLPFTTSWGWATWRRSWKLFDKEMKRLIFLEKDSRQRKKFDLNNSYPYYDMLLNQKLGRVDSWAIRFYLSVFINNGLTLYPKKTLVYNNGFDGSGVHTKYGMYQGNIDESFDVNKFPNSIAIDEKNKKKVFAYIKRQNNIYTKVFRIVFRKIFRNV